ncbi:Ubiquitin hydrolase [Pseudoloma neurophilia]|uniref:Ubiquitin hydrolase n=1 Tax=Pseudoloma neurophilia TaxID=146866 RepID=A0A0R0LXR6_9MICR|nr:Ubiquitin hydrolase [Pseudoloma neurophilia]
MINFFLISLLLLLNIQKLLKYDMDFSLNKNLSRNRTILNDSKPENFLLPDFITNNSVLSEENLNDLIKFIDKVIFNFNKNLPTPYYEKYKILIKKNLHCGMSNFNGYCFLNSVLQIMFSSSHFIDTIYKKRSNSIFFREIYNFYKDMKKNKIINQVPFLKWLDQNYKLDFDIKVKTGYVSDVIRTFYKICKDENCSIFSFISKPKLCTKYPIIRSFKNSSVRKKSKIANILITDLQDNKILIFSGNMDANATTPVIGKTGKFLTIKNRIYELFGIVEKVSKKFVHTRAYAKRNSKWFLFNDECVTEIEENHVLENIEPYFAFYELVY